MPVPTPARPVLRRRRVTTTLRTGLGLLLLSGLLSSCQEPDASPSAAVPALTWRDCGDGLECATAEVPLDHDEPKGEQIDLALVRLPATDREQRIGSLFTNPGGPGLSGVADVRASSTAGVYPEQLRERFDIVGLDPRGVGQSTPVRCFDSVQEQTAYAATSRLWPTAPEEVDAFVDSQEDLARRCGEANGDLLDHLSTANVARDLDLLRRAVGDDRLSFVGRSYGTYLGATYASMFPDRVRALVLDGVADPVAYAGGDDPDQSTPWLRAGAHVGATETLDQFLELCAGSKTCAFGRDGDPREKLADLVDALTRSPLLIENGTGRPTRFGADRLLLETLNGLYLPSLWTAQGAKLQRYADMVDEPAGTVHPAPADPTTVAEGYDNAVDAQSASICVDADHPDSTEGTGLAAGRERGVAPYAADRWSWGISGICPAWAGTDEDRYTGPFEPRTESPILVVGTRYDPATPYRNAERLAADLPNAALLTLEGWGHTASFLRSSTCIDDAVTQYLITQEPPGGSPTCAPDAAAVPFAASPQR